MARFTVHRHGICFSGENTAMSSPYESADLILKLYDLRREEVMRKARGWYMIEFHPVNAHDVVSVLRGEHSAYFLW